MTREVQITFSCADPAAMAAFWAEALHYQLQDPPDGFASWEQALDAFGVPPEHRNDANAVVDPAGAGPRVYFQKVPETKTARNFVHLDLRAAPGLAGDERMAVLEQEADRLIALGAKQIQRYEPALPLESGHIVLADPEGNEFCLD